MKWKMSSMAVLYKCDGCDEVYDTYTQAYECHLPLDYEPEYWEQLVLLDEELDLTAEKDCE